jgi:hypothetical protein
MVPVLSSAIVRRLSTAVVVLREQTAQAYLENRSRPVPRMRENQSRNGVSCE